MITPSNPEEAVFTLSMEQRSVHPYQHVETMMAELPADLLNAHVIVDVPGGRAVSPVFIEELTYQIMGVRLAKSLTFRNTEDAQEDLQELPPSQIETLTTTWMKAPESRTPASAMSLNNLIQSNSYLQLGKRSLRYSRH